MNCLKLIAIDLDRTLLRDDNSYDYQRFENVYRKLSQKGILFAIISGHSRQDAKKFFNYTDLTTIYFVTHNGNYIDFDGHCTKKIMMSSSTVNIILREIKRIDSRAIVIDNGNRTYSCVQEEKQQKKIEFSYPDITFVNKAYIQTDRKLLKIAILSKSSKLQLQSNIQRIKKLVPDVDVIIRQGGWIECHQSAGGKGEVLNHIQTSHQISVNNTLIFGNGYNDVAMMHYAKYTVAMKNSCSKFLKSASYLIGSNEDQAVISLLEKIDKYDSVDFMKDYKVK